MLENFSKICIWQILRNHLVSVQISIAFYSHIKIDKNFKSTQFISQPISITITKNAKQFFIGVRVWWIRYRNDRDAFRKIREEDCRRHILLNYWPNPHWPWEYGAVLPHDLFNPKTTNETAMKRLNYCNLAEEIASSENVRGKYGGSKAWRLSIFLWPC